MLSVPFTMEAFQGFADTHGVLRLEDDTFVLEFQTKDALVGMLKSAVKTVRLPIAEIADVTFRRRFFGSRLVIRAKSVKAVEEVPGNQGGEITLGIRRKHRKAAGMLATMSIRMEAEMTLARLKDLPIGRPSDPPPQPEIATAPERQMEESTET